MMAPVPRGKTKTERIGDERLASECGTSARVGALGRWETVGAFNRSATLMMGARRIRGARLMGSRAARDADVSATVGKRPKAIARKPATRRTNMARSVHGEQEEGKPLDVLDSKRKLTYP